MSPQSDPSSDIISQCPSPSTPGRSSLLSSFWPLSSSPRWQTRASSPDPRRAISMDRTGWTRRFACWDGLGAGGSNLGFLRTLGLAWSAGCAIGRDFDRVPLVPPGLNTKSTQQVVTNSSYWKGQFYLLSDEWISCLQLNWLS